MEEDKVQKAMATKLVEAMEPDRAKVVLLGIVAGVQVYEAILDDGNPAVEPEKPEKKKRPRRPRSDKGRSRLVGSPDASAGASA